MNPARTAALLTSGVAFDTETHRVQPGLLAPPLVCASLAAVEGAKPTGAIVNKADALRAFRSLLESDVTIVGANIAYDMLVMAVYAARQGIDLMPAIFAAYDAARVYDVQIAEALHGVALGLLGKDPRTGSQLRDPETGKPGRYSLATCVDLNLGRRDAKVNDRFRQSYALLEDIPIEAWPFEARTYPVDDAINTLEVALAQSVTHSNLHNLAAQCYAAWAMHLGAAWGFNVDPAAVDALEARVTRERAEGIGQFIAAGFYKLGPDGKPLTSPKTGAPCKHEAVIKRLTALAYGCKPDDPCPTCAGKGRTPGTTKCKGCDGGAVSITGHACIPCQGLGRVPNPKTTKGCDDCDSTGLRLAAAPVPLTETGGLSIGRDALSESGDELLMSFAEFGEDDKVSSTYIPWLRKGIGEDGRPIPLTLRPNVLLANGRASYADASQTLPRKSGVRECITARPGKVLWTVDFGGLELATHAQSCLWIVGWSKLAEALNAGTKVHDLLGGNMAGITYEDAVRRAKEPKIKAYRQAAKPLNFGLPGGMGAVRLVLQQRKQGPDTAWPDGPSTIDYADDGTPIKGYKGLRFCLLTGGETVCGHTKVVEWKERPIPPTCLRCIECAEVSKGFWLKTFPENVEYFKQVKINLERDRDTITQHVSRRVRGGVGFCDGANGYFSGLASDGAKLALCRVAKEQFTDRSSPLYGSRTIPFLHDELIGESDESVAHEAAHRVSEIMIASMREFTPDVVIEAPPALMRKWYKGADPVYDANGRLVPWEPKR